MKPGFENYISARTQELETLDDLKPGFENSISARNQEPATLDDLKPGFENYISVRNQEPATLDDWSQVLKSKSISENNMLRLSLSDVFAIYVT